MGRRQLGRGRGQAPGGPLRRALVTGGTGRLGSAIAARLEAEGWRVAAAGRKQGDLRRSAGARTVTEWAGVQLGGLDLLVNAAAAGFDAKPFAEVTEEDWHAAVDVAAKGSFFVTQAAAPLLRESSGVVVMIEDVAAYQPWPSFAAHCAGKAAQAMLTKVLARALAPDVRVVGVAPGPVAVDPERADRQARSTLLGRVGSPEDVAEAVLYLAGADFVTGTSLVVDGGRLLQTTRPGEA